MSNIRRCYECGSWGTQCMSDSPVDGCRCVRCASATIASLTADVERLRNERDMAQITVAMKQGVILDLTEKVDTLRARCDTLARLVYRYRHGVPLGHQPHMIASEADKALKEPTDAQ